MGGFSDTGEYDGKPGAIVAPCFLIRHPKGELLWDAGLGDHYNYPKEGSDAAPGVHVTVPVTLIAQLQSLSLSPKDINFIAFSHLHWDHTGKCQRVQGFGVDHEQGGNLRRRRCCRRRAAFCPKTWSAYKKCQE